MPVFWSAKSWMNITQIWSGTLTDEISPIEGNNDSVGKSENLN